MIYFTSGVKGIKLLQRNNINSKKYQQLFYTHRKPFAAQHISYNLLDLNM